jgi:hypothetical protein
MHCATDLPFGFSLLLSTFKNPLFKDIPIQNAQDKMLR